MSGLGIRAKVNNEDILLGNSKILDKFEIKNEYKQTEGILSENGNSIVYVVKDKKILAIIGINDILRENVKEVVKKLNEENIETIMLTRR